jgi:hypothetical protein
MWPTRMPENEQEKITRRPGRDRVAPAIGTTGPQASAARLDRSTLLRSHSAVKAMAAP